MAMGLMVAGRRVVSRLWRRTVARVVEAPTVPAMPIAVRPVRVPTMITMVALATVLTVPTTVALATAPAARR